MSIRDSRYIGLNAAIIVALLSGCAAPVRDTAVGIPARAGAAARSAPQSWMTPAARTAKRLLYVGDQSTDDVYVYNYDSGALVGTLVLSNTPYGLCVDAAGNVYITAAYYGEGEVLEYSHGGSNPIKTLRTDGAPVGCSIDPANGDLAVANNVGSKANVQVWKGGSKSAKEFSNDIDCYQIWASPGYDDKGNLFMQTAPTSPGDCELPAGSSRLQGVYLDRFITGPGSVMWDGKYLTLTITYFKSGSSTAIYQVRKHRSRLIVVHTTRLDDHGCGTLVPQTFIVGKENTPANHEQGTAVVGGGENCHGPIGSEYWKYPASGPPFKRVRAGSSHAYGVAVSIAP